MKIKLFHISTDEVYGSITRGEFKENDTYYPSSPYSASKGCADLIAASFNRTYGAEIKILNLTNNYGPYQFPEKFIPTLISYFLKSKQAPIYGKGKNIREWMHVEDSCNAIWKSVISKKKFESFNFNVYDVDGHNEEEINNAINNGENSARPTAILCRTIKGRGISYMEKNNLWHYKFTWNPRNVVLAGQGGAAEFIQEGTTKYIPYHRLFRRTEFLDVEGYGRFEALANRNSLKYRSIYGLEDVLTLYRGTMRRVGFSKAWNMFVQLGLTDDSYKIDNSEDLTYRDYINLFLPYSPTDSVELKMRHALRIDQDDLMWYKLLELDIFNEVKKIGIKNATPAQALQRILEDNWTLKPDDKDMIVMYHKFGYELNEQKYQIDSKMVLIGEDQTFTAMAATVGLPVAMAALMILNKKITTPGVQRPISKEVYAPILKELEDHGIHFKEEEVEYLGYNSAGGVNG